jgi:hypothetical protein
MEWVGRRLRHSVSVQLWIHPTPVRTYCSLLYEVPVTRNTKHVDKDHRHWEINSKTRLTPWSRVLPEKLSGPQLLNKFPVFYENRRFIIAFT